MYVLPQCLHSRMRHLKFIRMESIYTDILNTTERMMNNKHLFYIDCKQTSKNLRHAYTQKSSSLPISRDYVAIPKIMRYTSKVIHESNIDSVNGQIQYLPDLSSKIVESLA